MTVKTVDARNYQPQDKQRVIFETFDSLDLGEKMELINDHDPRPLFNKMQAEREGKFEWDYLEEGPDLWRISIGKKYLSYI